MDSEPIGPSCAPDGVARLLLPDWAEPLLEPARYKSVRGGRGGGKSHALATVALLRLLGQLPGYPPGPVLCALGREHKNATDRSVAAVLEAKVEAAGLAPWFEFRRGSVRCLLTGSEAVYVGLNRDTVESLRSMEGLAVVWVEEAHRLSAEVAEVLVPSVRAPGSELWFSWNPRYVTDWTWQRFVEHPRPEDVSIAANWPDNPWFPPALDDERRELEDVDPALAAHVYGGQPRQDATDLVLAPAKLRACVLPEPLTPGHGHTIEAGFDVAFGGADRCALVIRRGADVLLAEHWPGGDFAANCARVHRRLRSLTEDDGVRRGWNSVHGSHANIRLWYDAGGGPPVDMEIGRLRADGPRYAVNGVSFGAAPSGPRQHFASGTRNGDQFARRNAQMAWAVRLRIMRGDGDDPRWRLRLPPDLPLLDELLRQCGQPTWQEHELTGRISVSKGAPSPDLFDALCLAFTADSVGGLRARPRDLRPLLRRYA